MTHRQNLYKIIFEPTDKQICFWPDLSALAGFGNHFVNHYVNFKLWHHHSSAFVVFAGKSELVVINFYADWSVQLTYTFRFDNFKVIICVILILPLSYWTLILFKNCTVFFIFCVTKQFLSPVVLEMLAHAMCNK